MEVMEGMEEIDDMEVMEGIESIEDWMISFME